MATFDVSVWMLKRSYGTMTIEVDDEASAEDAREQAQRLIAESDNFEELVDGQVRTEAVDFGADDPQRIEGEGQ